jgi:hypothetical protein
MKGNHMKKIFILFIIAILTITMCLAGCTYEEGDTLPLGDSFKIIKTFDKNSFLVYNTESFIVYYAYLYHNVTLTPKYIINDSYVAMIRYNPCDGTMEPVPILSY